MMLRFSLLIPLMLLTACGTRPDAGAGKGKMYSYVDAQGNLVTVERPAGKAGRGKSPAGKQSSADMPGEVEAAASEADEESYQTAEEVEKKVEAYHRDRFVSYVGPDGEVINRPLDLVAEREARAAQPAPYEEVDTSEQYIETISRVPADCCRHALEQAVSLAPGNEKELRFGPGEGVSIRLDQPRPAVLLKLDPALGSLVLKSFVHSEAYLSPRLLMLDASGLPVLKVDNLFTRRYAENWHRFGYFEGELPLEAGHAWAVLYLPYGIREEDRIFTDDSLEGVVEDGARPALEGELVVGGRGGDRVASGGG